MREFGYEIRYACRSLLKSRGCLFSMLLSLVLGIGASALVLAIIEASAFHPAPYARSHELVQIMATDGDACDARCPDLLTGKQLRAVRTQTHFLSGIAAYKWNGALLQGTSAGARASRTSVSGEFF